jgi:glycosyltransferase involved in cell wall biosynthesis
MLKDGNSQIVKSVKWLNSYPAMEKKVSVVMCTYNGAKYLREQLESIVRQTYPIYELIIQDDCSTDNTPEILKEYSGKYPYVCIIINQQTMGINRNFFSAMNRATGDYIAISDQDDIWESDKIEKQIVSIGDNWLSFHLSKPFSEDGTIVYFNDRLPNYGIERAIYQNHVPGHTMLLKREIIPMLPEESKKFFIYDHLFQIVTAAFDKMSFCNQVLVHQRRHFNAATYTPPINTQFNIVNSVKAIFRTFFLYIELRDVLFLHFNKIYKLLKSLPGENQGKANAEKLALYQSQKGMIAYIKLTVLCIKLRKKIFYTEIKNDFIAILRAVYFPISCVDYIRYMLKKH